MEPLELALKHYRELSPAHYLEYTHDGVIYDITFDGETLVLDSEAWISTVPLDPKPNEAFRPIFGRYRATFHGISDLETKALDLEEYPPTPTLADFVGHDICTLRVALPNVAIETNDDCELRFSCRSFDVERFEPTLEQPQADAGWKAI